MQMNILEATFYLILYGHPVLIGCFASLLFKKASQTYLSVKFSAFGIFCLILCVFFSLFIASALDKFQPYCATSYCSNSFLQMLDFIHSYNWLLLLTVNILALCIFILLNLKKHLISQGSNTPSAQD
jgi:hypothetical protein